jgi:hypothetical protein
LYRPYKNHKVVKSPEARAAAEAANVIDALQSAPATTPETPGAP